MKHLVKFAALAALVAAAVPTANAQSLGRTPGAGCCGGLYGYGGSNSPTWTATLDSDFGGAGNITAISDLSGDLSPYTALLVDLRDFGDAFSGAESSNIASFLASGRRMMIFGENLAWPGWDASIAGLFGASVAGNQCFSGASATAVSNALTAGVGSVSPGCSGELSGGTSLFADPFAILYGPSANALVLMDVNTCSDAGQPSADNARFCSNAAQWLADSEAVSATPEPASVVLVASGLIGVAGIARRRRKAA